MGILWTGLICSGVWQTVSLHRYPQIALELPAGRAVPVDDLYNQEFVWLLHHMKPDDTFLQVSWLNLYFPMKLRSPVFVDGLWADKKTTPELVALTIRQVEHAQIQYILWSPRLTNPHDPNSVGPDSLGPFRDYLISHYTRIQAFSNQDEIWQRQ